ncbi:MAG: hypothetical protein NDI77_13415 [Geobacteraceae bacterium]|nr:hypothetical protein [Geobacteraceae bacterium]
MADLIKKIIWVLLAFAALLFFAWPVALLTPDRLDLLHGERQALPA